MKKCPTYNCKKIVLTDGSEILPQKESMTLTATYGERSGLATIESPCIWKGEKYESIQLVFPNKAIFMMVIDR